MEEEKKENAEKKPAEEKPQKGATGASQQAQAGQEVKKEGDIKKAHFYP